MTDPGKFLKCEIHIFKKSYGSLKYPFDGLDEKIPEQLKQGILFHYTMINKYFKHDSILVYTVGIIYFVLILFFLHISDNIKI